MAGKDFLLFLAVSFVYSSLIPPAVAYGNPDGDALSAFRRGLSDPNNAFQSWDPNLVDPCTWLHITCDQDNRVTRLDLGGLNLYGPLVPELGNLAHLQYMELYENNIQGTIPAEIGNLTNLISLDLYNNNISGTIPPSLGNLKSVVFIRLNNNQLTGYVPLTLIALTNLKEFDVSNNHLCTQTPPAGQFEHIPLKNFENHRLEGRKLLGLPSDDSNCS